MEVHEKILGQGRNGDFTFAIKLTCRSNNDVLLITFLYFPWQVHPTVINLTATHTSNNMRRIMKYLGLRKEETFLMNSQPLSDKLHITIMDKRRPFSLASLYLYFANEGSNQKRVIIFLNNLEDCGALYRDLCTEDYGKEMKQITRVISLCLSILKM